MKHHTPARFVAAAFLAAVSFAAAIASYGQSAKPAGEQARFSKSTPVEHPMAIPPDVLKLLLSTKEGKEGMARASDVQKQNPELMFRTAQVHLHGADEDDLVIEGLAPMKSGDHDWFWVVRPAARKPRIALFAGGTSLEVLDSRTGSYRDINSVWVYPKETLVSVYKFDGKKYTFRKIVNRTKR